MSFSHPSVDAFIMWGFWDGNHWHQNAPIFNLDWSIKPSGQAYIDKVFNEWWTNEELLGPIRKSKFQTIQRKTQNNGNQKWQEKIQEVLLSNDVELILP